MDFPDGSFGLLDGGPLAGAPGVIPYLQERIDQGRRFRLAGISQWDADHIRGIPAILDRFTPEEFRYPGLDLQLLEQVAAQVGGEEASRVSEEVRSAIDRLPPARVAKFTAPDPIPNMGEVEVHVLSPMARTDLELRAALEKLRKVRSKSARSKKVQTVLEGFRNRASVALWIRAWGRVLFLSGEVGGSQYRAMEEYFLRPGGAQLPYRNEHGADWMKLSHHGANKNNPPDLFKFFARTTFVASASAGGGYDHPHPATLKRARALRQQGPSPVHQPGEGLPSPPQRSGARRAHSGDLGPEFEWPQ